MRLGISRIEYVLGKNPISNSRLRDENPDWDVAAIMSKTGVETRYAVSGESVMDLGYEAARRVMGDVDKGSVDCLLAVTSTSNVAFPGIACFLQHKLGLGKQVFAFDINLGCSGFVYAYMTLAALAEARIVRKPLLVCADTYTKFIGRSNRAARPIFSDAAAATLFVPDDGMTLLDYDFGTDGSGATDLMLQRPSREEPESPQLHMDGAKVLMFTMSRVPESVRKVLGRQGLQPNDVNLFVFHQASKVVLDNLERTLRLPAERVFRNISDIGNTVSCTIPICMKQLMEDNRLSSGSLVLICGFGVGLSWATCLLRVE